MLMRGQFSAIGNCQVEDNTASVDRETIPLIFLKDAAWADPFTDTIMTDWMYPHHFAGRIFGYRHVRLDGEEFFRVIAVLSTPPESRIQNQETTCVAKKTRTRPKEDVALLQNRIESIIADAHRLDPGHRIPLRALAAELAIDPAKNHGYRTDTIRQILSGTYRPMKRLEIRGLHQRPVTKAGNVG